MLKQNVQIKNEEVIVKATVFDVPAEVWRSGFDSFSMGTQNVRKVIMFKEYAAKRENTEFVREFNLMCAQ